MLFSPRIVLLSYQPISTANLAWMGRIDIRAYHTNLVSFNDLIFMNVQNTLRQKSIRMIADFTTDIQLIFSRTWHQVNACHAPEQQGPLQRTSELSTVRMTALLITYYQATMAGLGIYFQKFFSQIYQIHLFN